MKTSKPKPERRPFVARVRQADGRIAEITVKATHMSGARRQAEKRSGIDAVLSLTPAPSED